MKRKARSITTGGGDQGRTSLFSGERIWKDDPQPEAYGDIDELVSLLGVARCHARLPETRRAIPAIQRELFVVGSELATSRRKAGRLAVRVDAAAVAALEERRSALESRIRLPYGFVLPAGTDAATHLDLARAVSRRCERRVVGLHRARLVRNPHLLVWMNKLSDYLWLLARREEGRPTLVKEAR